jgi:hypothetical protein
MTKEFYQSLCFSLGLTLLAGLFQSWLHFQLGIDLYSLSSFPNWFLVGNFIALNTAILLLMYYRSQNYQATFWTGLVASLSAVAALLYLMLARLYPLLGQYPQVSLFLGVITYLVYALTLVLSRASLRPWLKRTGIVLALLYSAQLMSVIWFINTPPYPPNAHLDLIRQWLSLLEKSVPILLLFNFVDELRHADSREIVSASSNRGIIAKGTLAILTICAFVLGIRLTGDSYNQTHISAREARLAQPFDEGSFISSQGDTLQYRLLKPLHYDPKKRYPLVVGLPYSCWSDNTRQIDACPMAKWLATDENRRKYPAFVWVPRCPPQPEWGGVANTPSIAPLAAEAILALDRAFSIDPKRRYITGVSRGGYGAWHLIGQHPELFAAAIPVCGEGNPEQAGRMKSVSVWAFHGAKDMNVPVRGSRDMVNALKKAGGAPRYTEYADAAHGIWGKVVKTPGLLDWLFTQKQTNQSQAAKI